MKVLGFLLFFFCYDICFGGERELVHKLLRNYDRDVRPAKNHSVPTTVHVTTRLFALIDVMEKQQAFQVMLWIITEWNDDYLKWKPEMHEGIEEIVLPARKVWTPDIIIYDTVAMQDHMLPLKYTYARVISDGTVYLARTQVLTIGCTFHIYGFPFDRHNCSYVMGSWTYISQEIHLVHKKQTNISTDIYHENAEWDIIDSSFSHAAKEYTSGSATEISESFDEITYSLTFRRSSIFAIYVMILPSFVITTICILGLFSPFNSGNERQEKVTLGLTTLLAMTVMLQLVADEVPQSREGLPLLGQYMIFEILVCAFGTAVAVFIMFIHQRAQVKDYVPCTWLLKITGNSDQTLPSTDNEHHYSILKCQPEPMTPTFDNSFANAQIKELHQMRTELRHCFECLVSVKSVLDANWFEACHTDLWALIFDRIDLYLIAIFLIINTGITVAVLFVLQYYVY